MTERRQRLLFAEQIEQRIEQCWGPDRANLRRLWERWCRSDGEGRPALWQRLLAQIERSEMQVARRRSTPVSLDFPGQLPITQHISEITAALQRHQVIVVTGATGSGKTTQVPKICLAAGRGRHGFIGCTQPRRLAARAASMRLAAELGPENSGTVGYKVRFHDHVGRETQVKYMTDGVLLAEIQTDRRLLAYDTLIVDEAHERSLNIDFLLGYLKTLLPRRPDLKLIVMSATLNPAQFAGYFSAPVIDVGGRQYDVEVRYRPVEPQEAAEGDVSPLEAAVCKAVADVLAGSDAGDILVFLSTERMIRSVAGSLRQAGLPGVEVLPLYARLSFEDQARVFRPAAGRRVILATNIAETSLTLPNIRCVIDTGEVRVSRYNFRRRMQVLPVEPISQASARQRMGRCGRTAPGVCVRLYSEEDLRQRAPFTDPEVLRTNLATVILKMRLLELGDVRRFPWLDPPALRPVNAGIQVLKRIKALDDNDRITPEGRKIARFPLDPVLGRMVLRAERERCLAEVLVLCAGLVTVDPRDSSPARRRQAARAHRSFVDRRSDFSSMLKLWTFLSGQSRELSSRQFRKLCRERLISYRRYLEWRDVYLQIKQIARELGLSINAEPAGFGAIHRVVLETWIHNVAVRQKDGMYVTTDGRRLRIFPGSAVAGSSPPWIVAAEIYQTHSRFARVVAQIKPAWLPRIARDQCRFSYQNPRWDARHGRVVADELTTFHGLVLPGGRRINLARQEPDKARELFLLHALVLGESAVHIPEVAANRDLVAQINALAARARRPDLVVGEESLLNFYRQVVPPSIVDVDHLKHWWEGLDAAQRQTLCLKRSHFLGDALWQELSRGFPTEMQCAGVGIPVQYHYAPGTGRDGVTFIVPLAWLNRFNPARFEFLVPGLLKEKVTFMLRRLPKSLRRALVPLPETASRIQERLDPEQGTFIGQLVAVVARLYGVELDAGELARLSLPAHLLPKFAVVDEQGRRLGEGVSWPVLQSRFAREATAAFSRLVAGVWPQETVTKWDFGECPETVTLRHGGQAVTVYPCLKVAGDRVQRAVAETSVKARALHRHGIVALVRKQFNRNLKPVIQGPEMQRLGLYYTAIGSPGRLYDAMMDRCLDQCLGLEEALIYQQADYQRRVDVALTGIAEEMLSLGRLMEEILVRHHRLRQALDTLPGMAADSPSGKDLKQHLSSLVFDGFVRVTSWSFLQHLPRYLAGLERRWEKYRRAPQRDLRRLADVERWRETALRLHERRRRGERLREVEWEYLLNFEEWRLAVFAQELGVRGPVSQKKMQQLDEALQG